MRRVVMLALLLYVIGATWTLTTRFVAWGDDVSVLVGTVARSMTVDAVRVAPDRADGIEFVECLGCEPLLPGAEGFPLALVALIIAGTPLAFRALAWRRQARAGGAWPGSGVAQFAAVIQAASLVVSMWMGPMVLGVLPYDVWSLAALGLGSLAVVNVVLGLPALFAWRELYAGAFARQRVFFPAAGQ